jgi:endonuclease/exonuclease/phosphatase family metal-dependent hydrolase
VALLACCSYVLASACAPAARTHGVLPLPASAEDAGRSCRQVVDQRASPVATSVSWLTAVENRDREDVWRWCGTVGPAVIITPTTETDVPALEQIAILTWNVHVGGGDLIGLVGDLKAGRLTDGQPIDHYVLLVQEALRTGGAVPRTVADGAPVPSRIVERSPDGTRQQITDVASRLGASAFYVPSMRNGLTPGNSDGEDRGNAILSNLPLSEFTAIELPLVRQRRVAVAATIGGGRGGARRFRVVSAHLEAGAGLSRLLIFSSGVRAQQARTLITALEGDGPVVIGADLNTWADARNERAFLELRRAFPQTPSPGVSPTFRLGLMLDYLFFRLPHGWTVRSQRIGSRFGSDHHPLLARLSPAVSARAAWYPE